MRFLKKIRENEYAVAISFQKSKLWVSQVTTELFLHLEIFVCRILVTVDLHIRDMPLFGCGRLIDLDETLSQKKKYQLRY